MSTEVTTGTSRIQVAADDRRTGVVAAAASADPVWQRAVMLRAPLVMGTLLLLHPGLEVPRDEWVSRLAALLGRDNCGGRGWATFGRRSTLPGTPVRRDHA